MTAECSMDVGNEVVTGMEQAEDGCVVALSAAGVEDDFSIVAVEEAGHGFTRPVNGGAGLLAVLMD